MDCLPAEFKRRGVIHINGSEIPRDLWHVVRPKPTSETQPIAVTFHLPLQGGRGSGKQIAGIVAALALMVVTVGISNIGLGAAGAGIWGGWFAAGSVSAKILAGAIGLVGALAISALTAPPTTKDKSINEEDKEAAGAEGNLAEPNGPIPRVIGTRKVYPLLASQPVIEFVDGDEVVEACYALAGPHQITEIRTGDADVADADDIEYQVLEGWQTDYPLSLITRQGKTTTPNALLVRHKVKSSSYTELRNQNNPSESLPKWASVSTGNAPDEFWLQLTLPGGLINTTDLALQIGLPFRIRIRRRGETAWRNLPELHYTAAISGKINLQIKFLWGQTGTQAEVIPTQNGWFYAAKNVPTQTLAPGHPGWAADSYFEAGSGNDYLYNAATSNVQNISIGQDTVLVYLDGAEFPPDFYDVQIKRGAPYLTGTLNKSAYTYSGNVLAFFDYTGSTTLTAPLSREGMVDDVYFARGVSIWNEHPLPIPGFATIAIKAKNRNLEALSCVASGYVRDYSGGAWDSWTTTSNPVPHFRDVLIGALNFDPLPHELLSDAELIAWRQDCIDDSLTCDYVVQGATTIDVLNIIAACGYARPYMSDVWTIVQDKDRSGDSPIQIFTPRNSRGFKFTKAMPRLPDGLRVTFRTDDDNYGQEQISVFLPGVTASDTSRMEQVTYEGLVAETKIRRRARFDLLQGQYRTTFYEFEAPAEAIVCRRGSLIAVNHDTLIKQSGWARILEVIAASTLNPSDKNANITLSNSNLTATKAAAGWSNVRSTNAHASGKYYFEATMDAIASGLNIVGIANTTAALNNYIGSDVNGMGAGSTGAVYRGGSAVASIDVSTAGERICIAVDLDADLFWARSENGNWNGSASADPATGTGGLALPSGLTSGNVYAAVGASGAGNAITVNFGETAFAFTAPSGFEDWASESDAGDIGTLLLDAEVKVFNEDDMHDTADMHGVTDMHEVGLISGVAIRETDGAVSTHTLSNATGWTDRIKLATPVAVTTETGGPFDGGSVDSIAEGCLVAIGIAANEYNRMLVFEVLPGPDLTARIIAVDEAPEIWSALDGS